MDVVTQRLLSEFAESQKIEGRREADQFEAFVNYITISNIYAEEFDFGLIATGTGEFGLDGLAIIVNDTLIDDEEQLDDLLNHSASLQVQFVFIQSKTSGHFDAGDMSKFFQAIVDFFGANLTLVQSERIEELHTIKTRLYNEAPKFTRGLPKLSMYYATTGVWAEDPNLCSIRDRHTNQLEAMHIFEGVAFRPLDATAVQKLYFQTKNAFKATITFSQNLSLPQIPQVREAYIGLLPVSEYVKMIADSDGNIRRRLFFDNIRDFQGSTSVNKSIAETLMSERRIEFPLRNNGITIVTRKLQRVGEQFNLEDFQIVNGCQTSHVIASFAGSESANVLIPIKIVSTEDEEITKQIIIASNRQNNVDDNTFWGLDPIHKSIEIYFESKTDDQRLYYERRPGQFNSVAGIEKVRIITKDSLLKNYASAFSELPNQVGRYYKDLIPLIGKDIFKPDHPVNSYFTAAYIGYRLEYMWRARRLEPEWKPFRFQLIMAARLIIERMRGLDARKKLTKAYCDTVDAVMSDIDKAQSVFELGTLAVELAVSELGDHAGLDRRTAKTRDMKDKLKHVVSLMLETGEFPEEMISALAERKRQQEVERQRLEDELLAMLEDLGPT